MTDLDKRIEDVLAGARPRPAPRESRKEEAFRQLRQELRTSNQRYRRRRQYFVSGAVASIAASVLVGIRLFSIADAPIADPDAVVAMTLGADTTLNGQPLNAMTPRNAPLRLHAGDTIATGADSALAITWRSSGSLRVGASTEVTFVNVDGIELVSGEIYYDSKIFNSPDGVPIEVATNHGTVAHVGTQFLVSTNQASTRISVREGTVSFGNGAQTVVVESGQSADFDDALTADFSVIAPNDSSWAWASAVAPRWNVDGQSTMDIIRWISRETGLAIDFADSRAEDYARNDRIRGIGEIGPASAMRIIPVATELRFQVDGSRIQVSIGEQM